MIRILIYLAVLAALALGLSWFADHPGQITITWPWLGREIRTSLLNGVAAVLLLAAVLVVLWRLLRFILRIPATMSLMARARRTRKGIEAISRGMIAAGAGDARLAQRASREASKLMGSDPLALLLQAQTAQISNDRAMAESAFRNMLENPQTKIIGLRGLYLEARRRGDDLAAAAFAKEAHDAAPLPWAGQALLEQRAMADDWRGALSVVESNIARKITGKATGNRQRGVLKTAIGLELSGRDPDEALQLAREAIKLTPDLIPAYVLAGRMLSRKGDIRRAARILEDGWRRSPHPELASAYIDLRPGDSTTDRLTRARTLAKLSPHHIESRLMLARAARDARDFSLARATIEPLIDAPGNRPTVRTCLLMADIEETQNGASGGLREWLARATRAPRDPLWIADGYATDTWAPASPVSGRIDAFVWETPAEQLSAPPPMDGRLASGAPIPGQMPSLPPLAPMAPAPAPAGPEEKQQEKQQEKPDPKPDPRPDPKPEPAPALAVTPVKPEQDAAKPAPKAPVQDPAQAHAQFIVQQAAKPEAKPAAPTNADPVAAKSRPDPAAGTLPPDTPAPGSEKRASVIISQPDDPGPR